jgi:hypothetical protein
VGDLELPGASARLALHKIEQKLYQPLEWVPLLDLPTGDGLVFQTTLAVTSGNLNFLEACYHLHTPHAAPFPGVVLSTGTEDYFDSAYYFDGGPFRFPNAGLTHLDQGTAVALPCHLPGWCSRPRTRARVVLVRIEVRFCGFGGRSCPRRSAGTGRLC